MKSKKHQTKISSHPSKARGASTSEPQTTILWHQFDFRIDDNTALIWAAQRGAVVPVYILDDADDIAFSPGGASRWWLYEAIQSLTEAYAAIGLQLVLKRGPSAKVLRDILKTTGAKAVAWNRRFEPDLVRRDQKIEDVLTEDEIHCEVANDYLLFEPGLIRTGGGTPFKVFTPFSRACFAAPAPAHPKKTPKTIKGFGTRIATDELDAWRLVPRTAKWPEGLKNAWKVGEKEGHKQLRAFITKALPVYRDGRNRPDRDHTSRLSPYLHYGHLSPRQVWHAIQEASIKADHIGGHTERYLLEILWREFSWHILVAVPTFPSLPLNAAFKDFPWRRDKKALQAWQKGATGYPIVDAGLRQLWQTGWMHNRVRMIVASFLVKDLLIDWRQGAAWFWDTLVDADLANNSAGWQWVAGCGADASPFFRVFNPMLQGAKFDPEGGYVRKFIPEIARLPTKYIHAPWTAPETVLRDARVQLGTTYPEPIVDHGEARSRALDALKVTKGFRVRREASKK